MKKIYLVAAGVLAVIGSTFGQRTDSGKSEKRANKQIYSNGSRAYTGVISSHTNGNEWRGATSIANGSNTYGDKAKGQQFNVVSPYKVEGAVLDFAMGKYTSGNPNSKVTLKLYNMNGMGNTTAGANQPAPGTALASVDIKASAIAADVTNQAYTIAYFTTPITVSNKYVLAVDLSTLSVGDSVRLWSNWDLGVSGGNEMAWDQWSDNVWYTIIHNNNWQANARRNFAIYPIVECTTPLTYTHTPTNSTTCGGTGSSNITVNNSNSNWTLTYAYIDNNADTVAAIKNPTLAIGNYNLAVEDELGCTISQAVSIGQPAGPSLSKLSSSLSSCSSANGSATIAVVGGASTYSYLWNDANVQTTATASNLGTGNYQVTVTDLASNCSSMESVTVSDSRILPDISVSSNTTTVCGTADGDATASVNGSSSYTYLWDDNASQTTATALNLDYGTYNVTVADAISGCSSSASISVSNGGAPSVTATQTNVNCKGYSTGSVTLSSNDDISGYAFTWTNSVQTGTSLTNLGAGVYNYSGTDATCTIQGTVTITEPTNSLSASGTASNTSCYGGANGTLTAQASGGTAPYSYSWNATYNTANVSNVGPGVYNLTVTDNKGCTSTTSATVSEPTQLTTSTTGSNVACYGTATGSATVAPNGGTAPYTYSWTGNYTTATINNLPIGTYYVVVTDNKGCTVNDSTLIDQPTPVVIAKDTIIDAKSGLADGSISVIVTGGTSPYTYSWSPSGGTDATASNLASGSYTVTVIDNKGCAQTATYSVGTITGLSNKSAFSSIDLYPNPVNGLLNIKFANASNNANIKLINITGQLVFTENISSANGLFNTSLDLSEIPSGVYFVQINSEGRTVSKKIIRH